MIMPAQKNAVTVTGLITGMNEHTLILRIVLRALRTARNPVKEITCLESAFSHILNKFLKLNNLNSHLLTGPGLIIYQNNYVIMILINYISDDKSFP